MSVGMMVAVATRDVVLVLGVLYGIIIMGILILARRRRISLAFRTKAGDVELSSKLDDIRVAAQTAVTYSAGAYQAVNGAAPGDTDNLRTLVQRNIELTTTAIAKMEILEDRVGDVETQVADVTGWLRTQARVHPPHG